MVVTIVCLWQIRHYFKHTSGTYVILYDWLISMMPFGNAFASLQMHLVIERAIVSQSPTLYLCDLNLTDIPLSITRITNLVRLYLSRNKISQIPQELSEMEHLSSLALDYNQINKLPSFLVNFQSLIKLNLNHNSLGVIPNEIFSLSNLEILWLNHTEIKEIPPDIGKLHKLDTFGARGNSIEHLPEEFGLLENLRWLTLQDNKLSRLPTRVKFQGLVHLNLSLNKFTDFPEVLTKMKDLQFCFFAGNFIRHIPDAVLLEMKHVKLLDLHKNPLDIDSDLKKHLFVTLECRGESTTEESDSEDESEDWADSVASSELNTSDEEEVLDELNLAGGGAVLWIPLVSKITAAAS